jgi:phosphatidylglycerol:prolipoprotein diacylglycerol transferase
VIKIGIDPVLFHFGGHFAIRWYSLIVVTAVGVTLWLATKEAARRGLDEDEFGGLAFLALPFGIIGARLFHVIDHWPDAYAANPIGALYIWEGGLAIWGAVIGALLAVAIWALVKRRSIGVMLDAIAPAAALGMAIGRLACIITGDAMGKPTSGPIGFAYTNPHAMVPQLGVYYVPTPVFEIILNLSIFAVLWRLRKRDLPSGALFLIFVALYSVGRFFITFWSSYLTVAFGLNQAQLISIAAFVISVPSLFVLFRRSHGGLPERGLGKTAY